MSTSLALPLGDARQRRPQTARRYTFDDLLERRIRPRLNKLDAHPAQNLVPIESVAAGDQQVLAACEPNKHDQPIIDLDVLADLPSVESVMVSTKIRVTRDLPQVCELLFSSVAPMPDAATLRHLPNLKSVFALPVTGSGKLDLAALPAGKLRDLAFSHWFAVNPLALEDMTGVRQLYADLFRESLDGIARMTELRRLHIKGPAKGWAKLRECKLLEEAHLIDVQIANLRRWNSWKLLRSLVLSGRGVKSLAGLEECENLEDLTLLNLAMNDLSPLIQLSRLHTLTLRMVAKSADLVSVGAIKNLRSLTIEHPAVGDCLELPTLQPLVEAQKLEELTILYSAIGDGSLLAIRELPKLRKVRLGPEIAADVEGLRAARPDLEIIYTRPDPNWETRREKLGAVTIQKPGGGFEQWSIFQSFAGALGKTNYEAEGRIKGEVRRRDAALARRLEWDTEADRVGIYSDSEADIRAVAALVNQMLAQGSGQT
ncbi:MAG TPA: hypothetical protein VN749_18245 [Candidatus Eisenbacteria bacterium]|nr:hypothetical protein [Candidatus Eisenbacteria bacterium]